jgi:hypothetical protein
VKSNHQKFTQIPKYDNTKKIKYTPMIVANTSTIAILNNRYLCDPFPGSPKIDNAVFSELYARDIIKFLDKIGLSKNDKWGTKLNFWYNLSTKGAHQEVHDHLGGPLPISYAAIHYVLFNKEEHTSALFYNPLTQILKCTQPATTDQLKLPDYSEFQKLLDVEEGDLIIFPSYVLHSVMTQLSEKLRITTAFNICIYDKTCHE